MKRSEIEALKQAFNIPDPERKKEFIASFNEKKTKNKLRFPVIVRYVSAAAMAAVVVVLWSNFSDICDFRDRFKDSSLIISEATSEIESHTDPMTTTSIYTSQTTVSENNAATQTTAAENDHTTTSKTTSAVHTVQTEQTAQATEPPKTSTVKPIVTTTAAESVTSSAATAVTVTTTTPDVSLHRDLTVEPNIQYDKNGIIIDSSKLDNNESNNGSGTHADDNILKKMKQESEHIIYASIEKIIYTSINGHPYTQENLVIHEIYKGDGSLKPLDRISIYIHGGYMPIDEYLPENAEDHYYPSNYIVYDSGGNNGTQNTGDSFVFFIKKVDYHYPKGVYVLAQDTDISVFEYVNSEYVSLGNSSLVFTSDFLD